jgi:hypothetical protein
MTEEKKQENIKDHQNELPKIASVLQGGHFIYTEKGMFVWHFPSQTTFEDSLKYLKYLTESIEKTIESIKEKEAQEGLKAVVSNKDKDYKQV